MKKRKETEWNPTNIPVVRARALRMDNLFELEDGSVAILDYESTYSEKNFTKYGRYIMEVIDRYLNEGKNPDIHMMVLYTADMENSETAMHRTACDIRVEAAYLTGDFSEQWMDEVTRGIDGDEVTDEVLMHLVLLPLTYKGNDKKQEAILRCVDLARKIPDKEQETFALAGILAFTDKIISEEMKKQIKEVLYMTQVGKLLIDEGKKEGDYERARKTALNMLKRGSSPSDVAEILEVSVDTVRGWEEEACAKV